MECEIGWLAGDLGGSLAGALRTLAASQRIELRPRPGEPGRHDVLIGAGALLGRATATADGHEITIRSPELAGPLVITARPIAGTDEYRLLWRAPE